jgi:hypothetical protein
MGRRRRREPYWFDYTDEELLDLRLCDLDLRIEGTVVESRIHRLYDELEARGIRLRPHVWLSREWFSPDGVPGIAVPFYLAHRRLMRLEQRMILEVEGGTARECMMLLRHEAGHAVCTAHRLQYRRRWRETFGKASQRYPTFYKPVPYSKEFVLHLDWWYAQAHPAEDFAETFAVWLNPNSRWRRQYREWPALEKLEFVDELMTEVAGQRPQVRSRRHIEPLRQSRITLRRHYSQKQRRYRSDAPDIYDRDLRRLFPESAGRRDRGSAAAFLRRVGPEIREAVAEWTGQYQYTIDQVLRDMIDRCKDLKLRLKRPERELKMHAMLLVAVQIMNYLHGGHHRIAL